MEKEGCTLLSEGRKHDGTWAEDPPRNAGIETRFRLADRQVREGDELELALACGMWIPVRFCEPWGTTEESVELKLAGTNEPVTVFIEEGMLLRWPRRNGDVSCR